MTVCKDRSSLVGIGLGLSLLGLIFLFGQSDRRIDNKLNSLQEAVKELQEVVAATSTSRLSDDVMRANRAERELKEMRARSAAGSDAGVNYYEPLAAPAPVEVYIEQ